MAVPSLEDAEQRVADGHVIAHLGNQFNDAVGTLGQVEQPPFIETEDHSVVGVGNRRSRFGVEDLSGLQRG